MTNNALFWDSLAERYAAQPVANLDAFERKQAITRSHLTPDSRVLEVGCGTGSLALKMAPHAAHIDALDISSEMLRIARGKADAADVTNVAFRQAALDEPLPFEPGTFDSVWAYSILHLVADRPALLARLCTMLKPGGTLISSTVTLGESWIPYRPMLAVMRWAGKAPHVYIVRRDELVQEMEAAAFESVETPDVGAKQIVTFAVARKPA